MSVTAEHLKFGADFLSNLAAQTLGGIFSGMFLVWLMERSHKRGEL